MKALGVLTLVVALVQPSFPLVSTVKGATLPARIGRLRFLLTAHCLLQSGQAMPSTQNQKPSKVPAVLVDINRASVEDFEKLPGIGPKLARQIVAYRQKHGPFRRVEDLMAIKGIGVRRWKKLRPLIKVGGDGESRVDSR